jgi:DNA-3-methyladenine glycosylase I
MAANRPLIRCDWAANEPLYFAYHDEEWGVPVADDQKLFEFLLLEGAQAGLSWLTILRKRENYRRAFSDFDPRKVACFDAKRIGRLLQDPGIVRNRAKLASAVSNARAFLAVQEEFGSFAAYQWRFVDGRPAQNRFSSLKEIPARSEISDVFSKDLRAHGQRPPRDLPPPQGARAAGQGVSGLTV